MIAIIIFLNQLYFFVSLQTFSSALIHIEPARAGPKSAGQTDRQTIRSRRVSGSACGRDRPTTDGKNNSSRSFLQPPCKHSLEMKHRGVRSVWRQTAKHLGATRASLSFPIAAKTCQALALVREKPEGESDPDWTKLLVVRTERPNCHRLAAPLTILSLSFY